MMAIRKAVDVVENLTCPECRELEHDCRAVTEDRLAIVERLREIANTFHYESDIAQELRITAYQLEDEIHAAAESKGTNDEG